MKRLSFRLGFIALLAMAASVFAPAAVAQQAKSDLEQIRSKGVLRVGGVMSPPLSGKAPGSEVWEGIVPDILAYLAEVMKVKLEYIETNWGTAAAGLQANRFDIVGAFNATPERALAVDFTVPIGLLRNGLLVIGGDGDKFQSWDGLNAAKAKITVVDGTSTLRMLQGRYSGLQWHQLQNLDAVYLELESGRATVAAVPELAGRGFVKERNKGAYIVPNPITGSYTHFALRKTPSPEFRDWLNVTLEFMRSQGHLQKLWDKYGGSAG